VNRNTFTAQVFVDELAHAGLRHVCAAPGSRHTPLMLAFAQHAQIRVWSHLDERSAAFFALGLARALDEPVALVCTSGTAGANMFPAVIEAHQSRVPLVVLTADRPHELRHSGANQTMDQVRLFGEFVLWFVDAALPESDPPAVAIRNLRTLAARALAQANGLRKGVVHINMPFRKPLEPTPVPRDATTAPAGAGARSGSFTRITTPAVTLSADDGEVLRQIVSDYAHGVILCGGGLLPADADAITALSRTTGYPVLAESYSHVRHGRGGLGAYDFYMDRLPSPDVIIRVGDVPISRALNDFIAAAQPQAYVHISPDGTWSDDAHLVTHHLHASIPAVVAALAELPDRSGTLREQYAELEAATWDVVAAEITSGPYFDGAAVYDLVELMPAGATLFAGNSLPVRQLDQFGRPQPHPILTYANRGTSGIDGNISTALGAGAARPDAPLVAVMGDITFYHDMNGLLAVRRCGVPLTLVLLNNDGGGIFHRLPIKDFEPAFTDYFITPHGLDFSHAAALYGLDYIHIDASASDARTAFRQAFSRSVGQRSSTLIEVRTNAQHDLQRRAAITAAVRQQIGDLLATEG